MPDADRLASIHALLVRHFGYGELRPLQLRVVTALEEGRDVLAVLPTGAGKSLCFQLPAMVRKAATIVVSPLISLMQDQVAAATARGLPAAAINSTLPGSEQRRVLDRVAEGVVRLLYTSPERLGRLAGELAERGVRPALLAVDEAHCISEWGADFRPAYRTLRRLRARLGWPQTIALTGSATPGVRAEIVRALGLGGSRGLGSVLGSFDRRNLWLGVARVDSERERLRALFDALHLQDALALVYAPTRNLVEELSRVLQEAGFRAAAYHAGLTSTVRKQVLSRFLADELGIVVATSAFGMGIDSPTSVWSSTGHSRRRRRRITRRPAGRGATARWRAAFSSTGRATPKCLGASSTSRSRRKSLPSGSGVAGSIRAGCPRAFGRRLSGCAASSAPSGGRWIGCRCAAAAARRRRASPSWSITRRTGAAGGVPCSRGSVSGWFAVRDATSARGVRRDRFRARRRRRGSRGSGTRLPTWRHRGAVARSSPAPCAGWQMIHPTRRRPSPPWTGWARSSRGATGARSSSR